MRSPHSNENAPASISEREFMFVVASIMSLMALGIDVPLPAFPLMREAYGLPPGSSEIGQSIIYYMLGASFPQLLFGPLSDRFGRRAVTLLGLGIYLAGAVWSALADSLPVLLVGRLFWGIGAGAMRVMATAMTRDRFEGDRMARFMSVVFALFVIVPVLAPSVGAGMLLWFPWRSVYWLCAVVAVLNLVWGYVRLPETIAVGRRQSLQLGPVWRTMVQVVSCRLTLVHTLAVTLLMGTFSFYLSTVELLVGDVFARQAQLPVIFGVTVGGGSLGSLVNGALIRYRGLNWVNKRLLVVFGLSTAYLALVTVQAGGHPGFWVWYPAQMLAICGYLLLSSNFRTVALIPMGEVAGTAAAVTGAMSATGAALLALGLERTWDGTTRPMSYAWFGAALLVVLLLSTQRKAHPAAADGQGKAVVG